MTLVKASSIRLMENDSILGSVVDFQLTAHVDTVYLPCRKAPAFMPEI